MNSASVLILSLPASPTLFLSPFLSLSLSLLPSPFLFPPSPSLSPLDPSQPKSEWSLNEGFVVEEGNDLLPPKNMDRTNLVECYHALLLATLMEEGLFEVSIIIYVL